MCPSTRETFLWGLRLKNINELMQTLIQKNMFSFLVYWLSSFYWINVLRDKLWEGGKLTDKQDSWLCSLFCAIIVVINFTGIQKRFHWEKCKNCLLPDLLTRYEPLVPLVAFAQTIYSYDHYYYLHLYVFCHKIPLNTHSRHIVCLAMSKNLRSPYLVCPWTAEWVLNRRS